MWPANQLDHRIILDNNMARRQDRRFAARTAKDVQRVLTTLDVDWELTAVLRLGASDDVIINKPSSFVGTGAHYIAKNNMLVATYSQQHGAVVVYGTPKKLGKIYLIDYNIFHRDHSWT